MASVTRGRSKELLPLRGKTLLDWNLDEAREAGAYDSLVITSARKTDLTEVLDDYGSDRAYQDEAIGLAHAVAMAGSLNPRLILLPDTVFFRFHPSLRITKTLRAGADIVVAVCLVSEDNVHQYGIVTWDEATGKIENIVEKPDPSETLSRWAIAGRFGMSRVALAALPDLIAGWSSPGEVHLPPLLNLAIQAGMKGIAIPLEPSERRFDCGSVEGYEEALAVLGP